MKKYYMYILFGLVGLLCSINITFSFDAKNRLVMQKSSNEQYLTGKYFCSYNIDIKIQYGGNPYLNCIYYVLYNSGNESVTLSKPYGSVWNQQNDLYDGSKTNGDYVGGKHAIKAGSLSANRNCSKLLLTGKNTSKTSTDLVFVNQNLVSVIGGKDDGLSVGADDGNGNTVNSLTGIQGITVPYEACPCILDSDWPKTYVMGENTVISGGRLTGLNKAVTILVYDQGGDTNWKYSYSGTKNLSNYKNWGISRMDNQEGVNSGTIVVKIYSGTSTAGTLKETLNTTNFVEVKPYTGTSINGTTYPQKTWDLNDRGYWVTFKNSTFEYEVEQPVTISIEAYDNALNGTSVVCQHNTNGGVLSRKYTFNTKDDPIIRFLTPSGSENVSPSTKFEIELTDTWAGIDTGTFILMFPTITGENDEILFTGFTINSGNLMGGTFTGVDGNPEDCSKGNACGYIFEVTLAGELPANTTMTITGYVKDLAGNPTTEPKNFTTMQSCKFFGCGNSTKINYVSGALEPITTTFTGSIIVLTGIVENNKGEDGIHYPRFEYIGDDCDLDTLEGCEEILMCSPLNTHPNLTGNIKVRNGSTEYTGSLDTTGLYITGLNWEYQSGVIIIN